MTVREDTMDPRLSKRNYREDVARALEEEKTGLYASAALSYKKAQHHATFAGLPSKAQFAATRRILCLKRAEDPSWKELNTKYISLYYNQPS